jgi:hypothetical protein
MCIHITYIHETHIYMHNMLSVRVTNQCVYNMMVNWRGIPILNRIWILYNHKDGCNNFLIFDDMFLTFINAKFLEWTCPASIFGTVHYQFFADITIKIWNKSANSIKPGQTALMCRLAWLDISGQAGQSLSVPAG